MGNDDWAGVMGLGATGHMAIYLVLGELVGWR
jgi:D-arabinose 1-dehydrogenase-like Zn-dependent alcohol dehydrogenase